MGLARRLLDGFSASPYPWSYTLAYPFYAKWPSLRNHAGLVAAPAETPSRDEAPARLVFFGDLMKLLSVPKVDERLVGIFSRADLVLGNLEGPLTDGAVGGLLNSWSKQIDLAYVEAVLTAIGASPCRTVLSVANNHAQDGGDAGLERTLSLLNRLGVTPIGQLVRGRPVPCGRTLDRSRLVVGIVAWTQWLNRPSDGAFTAPDQFGVIEESRLFECLPGREVDTRIGLPHWDFEYQHFPSRRTRALARRLADVGFDVIGGTHQHVIQPLEIFGACHVLYGAGNFLQEGHGISRSLASRLGTIWEVGLATRGADRGRVCSYRVIPFLHDRERGVLRLLGSGDSQAVALFQAVHASHPKLLHS